MALFYNGFYHYTYGRQTGNIGGSQIGGGLSGAQAWRRTPSDRRGVPAGGANKWAPPVETPFPTLQGLTTLSGLWLPPHATGPWDSVQTRGNTPAGKNFIYLPGPARPVAGADYNGYRSADYTPITYVLANADFTGYWAYGGYTASAGVGGDEGLWSGAASAGGSFGRDFSQPTNIFVPTNAGGLPEGDGLSMYIDTIDPMTTFFSNAGGMVTVVFYAITAAAAALGTLTAQTPYANPALVGDTGFMGLHFSDAGLTAGAYDATARNVGGGPNDGWQMITQPCPINAYTVGQMRWGNGSLDVRAVPGALSGSRKGRWASTPFGGITTLTGPFRMFGNYNLSALFNGDIYHVSTRNYRPSNDEADGELWAAFASIGQST